MKQLAPVISSISLRSPQKTSGLFDIGVAGGSFDVTSLNLNAPEFLNDPYQLDDLKQNNLIAPESVAGVGGYMETKPDNAHQHEMDSFDILDPLGDLETDQLMDDNLDAFVDLEQFLMGGTFFDEAEVKPFIDIPTIESMIPMVPDTNFLVQEVPTKSRKRKAEPENTKQIKTSMFEISVHESDSTTTDPQLDHDYTAKRQRLSPTSGDGAKRGAKEKANIIVASEASTSLDAEVLCSEEAMTDKQAMRRMKNNVASKKSREQRKQKFADLDQEAEKLIIVNEELRQKISELEKLAQEMKAQLVAKMTGK